MIAWLQASALWALPLAALPLVIHLLRRRQAERVVFPSVRFVPSSQAASVRLRAPSDHALLVLRTLAVLAVVIAAAQPLWVTAARRDAWDARIARAVVVDTSASMRAGSAADEARDAAARESQAAFVERFESAALRDAIRRASAWLSDAAPARREIVVLSDFQLGAFSESLLAGVPADTGIRLVQVGAPVRSRQVDGATRLGPPDAPALRERVVLSASGTEVLDSVPAPAGGLRVEGSADADARRLLRTLAAAGTPAPDPAQPIVLRFGDAMRDEGAAPPRERWMLRTLFAVERNLDLVRLARQEHAARALGGSAPWIVIARDGRGAPFVRAAAGGGTLVVDVAAPVDSYVAAAAARTVLVAAAAAPDRDEEEVLRHGPETLAALTRPPARVAEDAWRRAESSDARWLWGAALVLLGIEGWLRGRPRRSAEDEARAAA